MSKTVGGACPWKTEPKRKREEGDPSYSGSVVWGLLGGVRKQSHQFRGRESCDSVTAGGLAPMVAGHHQEDSTEKKQKLVIPILNDF